MVGGLKNCLRLAEGGGGGGWTVLWMDRVFNSTAHWILCHRLLRLYVEWEELAESSRIPESLRHVVWLAEQNPHSGEEQTWLPHHRPPIFPRQEFSPNEEKGGSQVCTDSLCLWKSLQTVLGDFSFVSEGFVSLQPLLFWPREKNFHLQVIVLLSSARHIWWSSLKWLSIAKQVWPWSTFDEKVVQEISCLWNVFSVTKRKLTARQCLSRSVYREDYLLLATPPPPPLYSLKGIVCRQFVKRNECRGFTFSAVKFFTTLHHPLVALSQKFRLPMQPLTFHLTTFSESKTFNSTLWLHMRSRKI